MTEEIMTEKTETRGPPALPGETGRIKHEGGWVHAIDAEGRMFWWNARSTFGPRWVQVGETIQIAAFRAFFLAERTRAEKAEKKLAKVRDALSFLPFSLKDIGLDLSDDAEDEA